MTDANILIEELNGANNSKIIKISGQLDESNVDEKIQQVYQIIENSPKGLNLIFDFSELDYLNSKSIGYLTDIYGKISENGGKVLIAQSKPNITDILQVVGLTQLIGTYGTVGEAKAEFLTGTTIVTPTASVATPSTVATPAAVSAPSVTITPEQPASIPTSPQPSIPEPSVTAPQAPMPESPITVTPPPQPPTPEQTNSTAPQPPMPPQQ